MEVGGASRQGRLEERSPAENSRWEVRGIMRDDKGVSSRQEEGLEVSAIR